MATTIHTSMKRKEITKPIDNKMTTQNKKTKMNHSLTTLTTQYKVKIKRNNIYL